MPKSHAYLQIMTKEPAKFQFDWYKTMKSCTHKVPTICSQMPKSEKENNSKKTPDRKMK